MARVSAGRGHPVAIDHFRIGLNGGPGRRVRALISVLVEIRLTFGISIIIEIAMRIDDAASRLEALGNPTRLRIYRALVRAGDAGLPVGRLQAKLDVAPSTLSHHLKALLMVGLITQERQATTLICRASYDVMRALLGFLTEECCLESGCDPASRQIDAS
jgi:DNA-binding transcriptional ArsR family regulator